MEYELDKDVSNWTVYEIVEYYKLLNMTSFESLICLNSILSLYCQFWLSLTKLFSKQNCVYWDNILFKQINDSKEVILRIL